MRFVGVDGCKAGWFAVGLGGSKDWRVDVFPNIDRLWCQYNQASTILIDIPIGLKESGREERRCDVQARKRLGKRRSSVFPAPCRQAMYAASYEEASSLNHQLAKRRLSLETWYIIPKIREVDCLLSKVPAARGRLREIHPELCFWAFSGQPMQHPKRTTPGHLERLQQLEAIYPSTSHIVEHALSMYKRKVVARDDILDALAAAVTAMLGADGLTTLPPEPERDERGLRMEMVYYPAAEIPSRFQ